jgi:hypothetical protein
MMMMMMILPPVACQTWKRPCLPRLTFLGPIHSDHARGAPPGIALLQPLHGFPSRRVVAAPRGERGGVHGEEGGVHAVEAGLDGCGRGHDGGSPRGLGVDVDVLRGVAESLDPGLVILPLNDLQGKADLDEDPSDMHLQYVT